jgi:hypothetical protein
MFPDPGPVSGSGLSQKLLRKLGFSHIANVLGGTIGKLSKGIPNTANVLGETIDY